MTKVGPYHSPYDKIGPYNSNWKDITNVGPYNSHWKDMTVLDGDSVA